MCSASFKETLFQGFLYKSRRFFPVKIFEHHHCRKQNGARVHYVFSRNVRGSSVGGFKDGVTCLVVDIRSRSNTDAAYHRCQLVGDVVPVQAITEYSSGISKVFCRKASAMQSFITSLPSARASANSRCASS